VAEAQERKVFDVVAVAAAPAVARETKAAKLSLRLIKQALAQPPGALHRILTEVLELTPEQLADFDELLERTSLTSVIYASKLVTDRLDFLHDLDGMLFDHGKRTTTTVDSPVTDTDGHTRIVDLMLSRAGHFADRRQHLVVELKRPSVKLTQSELAQITNYAVAVSRDDRFTSPDVTWESWLLGDTMDQVVEELVNKKDAPPGLYTEGTSSRIWVRRWAEVLEENRQRLHFYRDHLNYVAPEEETELNAVVRKYLVPATEPSARATSGHDAATA
jgi:hypothetical protein